MNLGSVVLISVEVLDGPGRRGRRLSTSSYRVQKSWVCMEQTTREVSDSEEIVSVGEPRYLSLYGSERSKGIL